MAIRDAIIAVDFDGTGRYARLPPYRQRHRRRSRAAGTDRQRCRVILYTMRSGRLLDDAVAWFARNDIPLYAVNENPAQREWTGLAQGLRRPLHRRQRAGMPDQVRRRHQTPVRQLGQGAATSRRRGLSRLSRPVRAKPAGYPVSSAPRAFVTNALGAFRKILPDADELPKRTETDFSRRYSLQTFSPQPMIFSAGCGLSPSGFAERRQTMLDDTTK